MRKDPVRTRANEALRHFNQAIRKVPVTGQTTGSAYSPEALQALDDAVRGYFSDKLNLVRHAHTFDDLEILLSQHVSSENLETIQSLYSTCSAGYYQESHQERPLSHNGHSSPDTPDIKQWVKTARQLISTIHPSL